MESASAGVTMNWRSGRRRRRSTSCRVSTVPAPTKQPSGTCGRDLLGWPRGPPAWSARFRRTGIPASASGHRAVDDGAWSCVPRIDRHQRVGMPASGVLGRNVSHPVHHSAKEPSGCRQIGPRQAWPRLSAARTACLVDLDAQARAGQPLDVPVDELQRRLCRPRSRAPRRPGCSGCRCSVPGSGSSGVAKPTCRQAASASGPERAVRGELDVVRSRPARRSCAPR